MKKQFIFTGTLTYFLITACNANYMITPNVDFKPKSLTSTHKYTILNERKIGTGGNPEVLLIHKCLRNNNSKALTCLNNLIKKEQMFYVSTERNWQPIKLAGRGTTIEKRTIKIKDNKELILYLDISSVKLPLSSNIEIKKSKNQNSMVIKIDVEKIEDKVTLIDNEGNMILDYTIIK